MGGGGEKKKIVILSTANSTQIPNHKTSKTDKEGEVEKNYKMLANPVFITPRRYTGIKKQLISLNGFHRKGDSPTKLLRIREKSV